MSAALDHEAREVLWMALSGAILRLADLRGSDLFGADMSGSDAAPVAEADGGVETVGGEA